MQEYCGVADWQRPAGRCDMSRLHLLRRCTEFCAVLRSGWGLTPSRAGSNSDTGPFARRRQFNRRCLGIELNEEFIAVRGIFHEGVYAKILK